MKFDNLLSGRLLRRYKRFLADVELADGRIVTAHTSNTGSMRGCATPGARVWLSLSDNPKRKYPHTWELIEVGPGTLAGINTARANDLVAEAIGAGTVPVLGGYSRLRREVRYGRESSRIDLLLEGDARPPCYVEVKNVTLVEDGTALFPDAVSRRGTKHLRELEAMVLAGARAVIFYCIQRGDAARLHPADAIDPAYGLALRRAVATGVEALAYRARVSPREVRLEQAVDVGLPAGFEE